MTNRITKGTPYSHTNRSARNFRDLYKCQVMDCDPIHRNVEL